MSKKEDDYYDKKIDLKVYTKTAVKLMILKVTAVLN